MLPAAQLGRSGDFCPLTGEALLSAWERGGRQSWSARALTLLSAGYPGLARPDAAALTLAVRDRLLLELRGITFGDAFAAFAVCQGCGEQLEFALPHAWAAAALEGAEDAAATPTVDDWVLNLRLADTADIDDAAGEPDIDAARTRLLDRCVTAVDPRGDAVPYRDLPEAVRATAETRLAALHEAGELSVFLACPACTARQSVIVDLSSYLWTEVRHAAGRLLQEVHELAQAHWWSETTILAMSAPRRRAYLELIRT